MNKKILTIAALILAIFFLLFPRVLNLDAFRTADEKRWVANTEGFIRNLSLGDWGELLRQPHPGITTQWLGALTIRFDDWQMKKLPLVLGQAALILAVAYVFSKLWGKKAGFLTLLLLAVDPFLFAHTRIYAMDSLLALFTVLSLALLFLWDKTNSKRYLFFSAFCASAAVLSKISGVVLIPFSLLFVFWKLYSEKKSLVDISKKIFFWIVYFAVSSVIILPSLAISPLNVFGDFKEFLISDQYSKEHSLGLLYYFRTLEFFSSPAHFLIIILLPVAMFLKKVSIKKELIKEIFWILLLALLFFLEMTVGAKKGDRYILPVFALFDVAVAVVIFMFWNDFRKNKSRLLAIFLILFAIFIGWQELTILKLFPHDLAYINPLTKNYFGEKRSGWGEGLDLAADYLNKKSDAKNLKVASYYPNEFAVKFVGETVSMNQFDEDSIDYVVIYRAMFERGDSYETDALNEYKNKVPEKVISFNGVDFVWIYKK